MQLFFTQNISDEVAILSEEEARHVKVLRKNIHDVLNIIDGTGHVYEARITSLSASKSVTLDIISKTLQPKKRDYYFHLFIAPTKQNERMEWMLEKAIEIGLDEITFIKTDHSEKARINLGRLEKIAISAIKQSGAYYLPKINDIVPFGNLLRAENNTLQLLAHCHANYEKQSLKRLFSTNKLERKINVYIGPEGDFSEKEITMAYAKEFQGLSLGNTRLRTETAGIYAAVGLSNLK